MAVGLHRCGHQPLHNGSEPLQTQRRTDTHKRSGPASLALGLTAYLQQDRNEKFHTGTKKPPIKSGCLPISRPVVVCNHRYCLAASGFLASLAGAAGVAGVAEAEGLTSAGLATGATTGAAAGVAATVFTSSLCCLTTWAALSCFTSAAFTVDGAAGVAGVVVAAAGACANAPTEEITRAAVTRVCLIISVSQGMAMLPCTYNEDHSIIEDMADRAVVTACKQCGWLPLIANARDCSSQFWHAEVKWVSEVMHTPPVNA